MAYVAICGGTLHNPAPGEGPDSGDGRYYSRCSAEWSGEGGGEGVECDAPGDGPPGIYSESEAGTYGGGYYYIACEAPFSAHESEGGTPAGFDASTAFGLFVSGFSICFAFWAVGKVPALVMRVLR